MNRCFIEKVHDAVNIFDYSAPNKGEMITNIISTGILMTCLLLISPLWLPGLIVFLCIKGIKSLITNSFIK